MLNQTDCQKQNTSNSNKSPHPLPAWLDQFEVGRFENCQVSRTGDFLGQGYTLRAFVEALMTDSISKQLARKTGDRDAKAALPFWSLCQMPVTGCGTDKGARNGLMCIDLDARKVLDATGKETGERMPVNVEALKLDISKYPGILVAAKSAGGHGVFAIIYAPDEFGGMGYAKTLAKSLNKAGYFIDLDEKATAPKWGRYEGYDAAPYVAPVAYPIAPAFGYGVTTHPARECFNMWGDSSQEGAVMSMVVAAMSARVRFEAETGKEYTAGCDVQQVASSGSGKTQYRLNPLRDLARYVGCDMPGGMRTTNAGLLDALIYDAYNIQRDENGKITGATLKDQPRKTVIFMDENGDVERGNAGDGNKALIDVIRRESYSGCVNIGMTKEMRKEYGGFIDSAIPVDIVNYRTCTPEQLRLDVKADKAGNGRRVTYCQLSDIEPEFDLLGIETLQRARARTITKEKLESLKRIMSRIKRDLDGQILTIDASAGLCSTAYRAAHFALERAGIDKGWHETMIYNNAAFMAALRIAMNDETFERAPLTITAPDIYAALDIALESNVIRTSIIATGLGEQLITARTAGEQTSILLEYVSRLKRVRRDALLRRFGASAGTKALLDNLCDEGILTYEALKEGRATHYYYSVTPDDQVETQRAQYGEFKARKDVRGIIRQQNQQPQQHKQQPKQQPKTISLDKRFDAYLEKINQNGITPASCGGNDNYLRKVAGKLMSNNDFMQQEQQLKQLFAEYVLSGAFNEPGKQPYTLRDAERLWKDRGLVMIAR